MFARRDVHFLARGKVKIIQDKKALPMHVPGKGSARCAGKRLAELHIHIGRMDFPHGGIAEVPLLPPLVHLPDVVYFILP